MIYGVEIQINLYLSLVKSDQRTLEIYSKKTQKVEKSISNVVEVSVLSDNFIFYQVQVGDLNKFVLLNTRSRTRKWSLIIMLKALAY